MSDGLYSSMEIDSEARCLWEGSIVLEPRLMVLADLTACVEWEFHSPAWLVWKPAWAQRSWAASWLPQELQVPRGAPVKRLDLALRTDDSPGWVYGGEVTLMSHGWGRGDSPLSGHAHAAFQLTPPLSGRYWPRLKHWGLTVDGKELDWSGSAEWPLELEGGWAEVEVSRRCGDALKVQRTHGHVHMTYTSPTGAKARGRSDYDGSFAPELFRSRNMLLPTVTWRWSGDPSSGLVRTT
jgi:hypothetical protein